MEVAPRRSTLWPMPGGVGHYVEGLGDIIRAAADTGQVAPVLAGIVAAHHLTGGKTAISYLRLAATLGFFDVEGQAVFLTSAGQRYLDGEDLAVLTADALVTRVSAVREILDSLSERPRGIGGLAAILKSHGHDWATQSQLRYRLRWMEEAGLVLRGDGGRPVYSVPATVSIASR